MRFYLANYVVRVDPDLGNYFKCRGTEILEEVAIAETRSVTPFGEYDLRIVGDDGTTIPTQLNKCIIWLNSTASEHAALIADSDIDFIELAQNDDSGFTDWTADVTAMNQGKFNQLMGQYESVNVPSDGLSRNSTLAEIFARFIRVFFIIRYSRLIDITTPPINLNSAWQDVSPTNQALFRTGLIENAGFTQAELDAILTPTKAIRQCYIDLSTANKPSLAFTDPLTGYVF